MLKKILSGLAAASAALSLSTANAIVEVSVVETMSGVEFNYAGTLDLTNLPFRGTVFDSREAHFASGGGFISANAVIDLYDTETDFGAFGDLGGISGVSVGDAFAVYTNRQIAVPTGYLTGDFLSGALLFDGETLASLGLFAGVYTTFLGNGDTIVMTIGDVAPIPVPAAALLFAPAVLALRKKRKA